MRWVAHKQGRAAWGPRKAALLVGVPIAILVVAGGTIYGVDRIQNDLADDTRAQLDRAGIQISDLDIDFEHRDGTITGVLSEGVTVDQARQAIDVDGVRVLDLTGLLESASEPALEPAPPATDEEPPPTTQPAPQEAESPPDMADTTGPTEVRAEIGAGAIILSGEVLTDEQRVALVESANDRFGAANVSDELTVTNDAEATPGADDRVSVLADLIGAVNDDVEGTAELTDTTLDFIGTAADDSATGPLLEVMQTAGDVDTSLDLAVDEQVGGSDAEAPEPGSGSTDDEIEALQSELDALDAEIRETVVFESGESQLSPAAQATLDTAVNVIQEYPQPVVLVSGHTDDRGTTAFNEKLSGQRAVAVAEYIVGRGVDPARIRSVGIGEAEPIADNATSEGPAENRRVELTARESFE